MWRMDHELKSHGQKSDEHHLPENPLTDRDSSPCVLFQRTTEMDFQVIVLWETWVFKE